MQRVQWTACGDEVHQLAIRQGLPPAIGERSRTLILGSLPGDVSIRAQRDGSVDCAIRAGGPNDLKLLLRTHPELTAIGFNARKAYNLFRKYVMQQERSARLDRLRLGVLPSSSPTPGRYALSLDEKVARWRAFLLS